MSDMSHPDLLDFLKERHMAKMAKAADRRNRQAASDDVMAMLSALLAQQERINAQLRELLSKRA